jgi:hypothetical protein
LRGYRTTDKRASRGREPSAERLRACTMLAAHPDA